ncbi:PEX11-domain-containing protein [Amniculicola lignicola CBS 123094]|uniref:PEX11-domain-containing protein n=1 Tax=Amniculicola lignicola CBS 123094 TaxID=1392246 RepID=A0A6A5VYR4_9PLEO|nr:PEX11-domain-containing protein [Amniculicola lignicola CBS 123094]
MVADALIYHPTVSHYLKFIALTVGRDKVLRTLQYFSRFLAWYLYRTNHPTSTISPFETTKKQFGLTRKLMRVGKFVEHFKAAAVASDAKGMDPVLRWMAVGRQLGYAGYMVFDNATVLDATGIHKLSSSKRLLREAYRAWFTGISCSIASSLYSLYVLNQRSGQVSEKDGEGVVERKKIAKESNAVKIQLISDLCDILVPTAALGWAELDDGVVGLAGTANLPFTIFEAETATTYQTHPREWAMTLHGNSTHIAKCLPEPLLARLPETYVDATIDPATVTGLPIYNGKTGALVLEMEVENPCRVSRRKLRDLFCEGIDVQYGKEIEHIFAQDVAGGGKRVKVRFSDGAEAVGGTVVGCDGARSRVRECICGEKESGLTRVAVSMFTFTARFNKEQSLVLRALNPLFVACVHPGHGTGFWISVLDVHDPSVPETWIYQLFVSWIDNPLPEVENNQAGRMEFFKKRVEEYAEPWKSVGRSVSEDTPISLDTGTYWEKAEKWDNRGGRMTLGGDAAHPMTPHRGQGLNNALQDASNFVTAIEKVASGELSLAEAVEEYDKEVLERGMMEMQMSLKQTMFIHDWDMLMASPMVEMGIHRAGKGEVVDREVK